MRRRADRSPTGLLAILRWYLLPCACLGCDAPIDAGRPLLGLCLPCRGRLRRCRRRCSGCGRPIATPLLPQGFLCGDCRRRPPAYDQLVPLYLYEPPLSAVVRQLKFGGLAYLGRHVARLLATEEKRALERAQLVVPIPLHWRRRLRRGYNQAEEIARPLAGRLGVRLARPLVRVRATPPQASLDRASRLVNPKGAFALRRAAGLDSRHIVLVDDVVTTGGTLDAAARELKRAGARWVTAAVLARTVRDALSPD